ncbi:Antirestriction protein ArdC [Methylophilus rhizosphaerae]|uniref:Antirestriction protein ArdC n=1 Tax=Methylophilus rhizosphaerae TaxID=492660 RepID=A0A1G9A6X4_9PROT|nr:zincin-like metallopeptidase domain-containing protein [Methylophilus rhizosphaerae]SDK23028.1 Antirestriction protein ArdC [Methylophilus rhizosphaerae]
MAYKKKETEPRDYRQELTDKTIIKIEGMITQMDDNPNLKWVKSWFTCDARPKNPFTGTIYKGINLISLMGEDFNDNRFYTYNNIADMEKQRAKNIFDTNTLNAQLESKKITHAEYDVRIDVINKSFKELEDKGLEDRTKPLFIMKGSKSNPVFKAMQVPISRKDDNEQSEDQINEAPEMIWKQVFSGNVFNATQISNIKPIQIEKLNFIPLEEAEIHLKAMIEKTNLGYKEVDQTRAFYSVKDHAITMPLRENFKDENSFYGVLLHEIGHSTGKHFNRDMSGGYGSKSYAKEELVAEISSVIMSADLGIPYDSSQHENHVAYLKSWVSALKDDKNFIFQAASKAEQSVSYQHEIRHTFKQELTLKNEHRNDLKQDMKATPLPEKIKSLSMSR